MMRTPSVPSSTTGASVAPPRAASSSSRVTNERNEVAPADSNLRARSRTRKMLPSDCSPVGQMATPAWALVPSSNRVSVSATGLRLRPRCRRPSMPSALATSAVRGLRSFSSKRAKGKGAARARLHPWDSETRAGRRR